MGAEEDETPPLWAWPWCEWTCDWRPWPADGAWRPSAWLWSWRLQGALNAEDGGEVFASSEKGEPPLDP